MDYMPRAYLNLYVDRCKSEGLKHSQFQELAGLRGKAFSTWVVAWHYMLPLSRETTQAARVFINSVLLAECETVLFRSPIFLPSFTTFFIYTREGVPRPLRVLEGALRPLEGWSDSSWQCEHPPIWVLILFTLHAVNAFILGRHTG